MQQATLTNSDGLTMSVTSRPSELNQILATLAEEVRTAAMGLCSTNLEETHDRLLLVVAQAEAAERKAMLLEPELET
jgi:hypothetical protein